jgi:hypothetical protein
MARKEHKITPKVIGRVLYTTAGAVNLESDAWFAWLADNSTFYFEASLGTFTARRELRNTTFFWYAFRRYRKKLYKSYLGSTENLTYERLITVAQQLAEKVQG